MGVLRPQETQIDIIVQALLVHEAEDTVNNIYNFYKKTKNG